jgi:hypothetical protein
MAGSTRVIRRRCTFRRQVARIRTLGVGRPRPSPPFAKVPGLRRGHTHLHASNHQTPWASLFHPHLPSPFFIPHMTHDSVTTLLPREKGLTAISLTSIIYHPRFCCTFIASPLALNRGHLICMDISVHRGLLSARYCRPLFSRSSLSLSIVSCFTPRTSRRTTSCAPRSMCFFRRSHLYPSRFSFCPSFTLFLPLACHPDFSGSPNHFLLASQRTISYSLGESIVFQIYTAVTIGN